MTSSSTRRRSGQLRPHTCWIRLFVAAGALTLHGLRPGASSDYAEFQYFGRRSWACAPPRLSPLYPPWQLLRYPRFGDVGLPRQSIFSDLLAGATATLVRDFVAPATLMGTRQWWPMASVGAILFALSPPSGHGARCAQLRPQCVLVSLCLFSD